MSDDIELAARLRAFQQGRAVRVTSHRQVAIRPDALVLCPIALAGEETTCHVVAVGEPGQAPRVRAVADPRVRDEQFALYDWLAGVLVPYFEERRDEWDYPQVWVASGAAVGWVGAAAQRLRYNQQDPVARRLGQLLTYLAGRAPVAGQQALHAATAVLRRHYATGQQEGEDEHLGVLRTWIEPPEGVPILEVVARAEQVPAGIKTDPAFDRTVLYPLVRAYTRARKAGAGRAELDARTAEVECALAPIATRIYADVQWAVETLQSLAAPPLPALDELRERERRAFEKFMEDRDAGKRLATRDRPRAAAFGFVGREDAAECVEAAITIEDRVGRARGRLGGTVVAGQVIDPRKTGREMCFAVATTQWALHVRRGDRLVDMDAPKRVVEVTGVRRTAEGVVLAVVLRAGQRGPGCPRRARPSS
jgi:hypothetical protein